MEKPNLQAAQRLLASAAPLSAAHLRLDVDGAIDDSLVDRLIERLEGAPRANTVMINVNSPGGDLYAAQRLVRAIDRHGAKRKLSYGRQVASAATLIFAAGNVRRLHADARLLLHGVAQTPSADGKRWTAERYKQEADTVAALDGRVANDLARRCCVPVGVIAARLRDERETPLAEALSIGLAHEVIGVSPPLQKAWPSAARRQLATARRFTAGAEARWLNPSFLAACEIGGI